jgi:hypothetical protein
VALKGAAACIAVACSTATVTAASARGPVFWPTQYAQVQLSKKYQADVACAPVGPFGRSHGIEVFGEFACDVYAGAGEFVIAVVPTGATSWKILKAGETSPVSGRLLGIVAAGAPRHLALLSVPDDPHSIMLEDQSTWKVAGTPGRLARWKPGDIVMVEPDSSRKHLYRVLNKGRGDDFEADFRGFG